MRGRRKQRVRGGVDRGMEMGLKSRSVMKGTHKVLPDPGLPKACISRRAREGAQEERMTRGGTDVTDGLRLRLSRGRIRRSPMVFAHVAARKGLAHEHGSRERLRHTHKLGMHYCGFACDVGEPPPPGWEPGTICGSVRVWKSCESWMCLGAGATYVAAGGLESTGGGRWRNTRAARVCARALPRSACRRHSKKGPARLAARSCGSAGDAARGGCCSAGRSEPSSPRERRRFDRRPPLRIDEYRAHEAIGSPS